jgi:hypothetical protein
MIRAPRLLTTLLVVAALSTPAFSREAAPRRAPAERPKAAAPVRHGGVLVELWKSLTNVWAEVVDNGCSIDPYGTCRTAKPQLPTGDSGCSIDPYGSCGH